MAREWQFSRRFGLCRAIMAESCDPRHMWPVLGLKIAIKLSKSCVQYSFQVTRFRQRSVSCMVKLSTALLGE